MKTTSSSIASFAAQAIKNTVSLTGGSGSCGCQKAKGNNGIGNGADAPPPGLVKNGRGDFNDGPGNKHGTL